MECKVNVEAYTASASGRGVFVVRVPSGDSAAYRARWLAELSDALDDAGELLAEFGEMPRDTAQIRSRVEAARREVLALRLRTSGGGGDDFGPEWTDNMPWKRSA